MNVYFRGWRPSPFIVWGSVRIGNTRMYCLGPVCIMIGRD